jgi:hypothetical protein
VASNRQVEDAVGVLGAAGAGVEAAFSFELFDGVDVAAAVSLFGSEDAGGVTDDVEFRLSFL